MDYLLNLENKIILRLKFINVVLNLIINGLPSKLKTILINYMLFSLSVLNLIINGLPSKQNLTLLEGDNDSPVLNLIINGLPSKLPTKKFQNNYIVFCFKPYYKWITF